MVSYRTEKRPRESFTWPRYRSGRQSQACRQLSARCECPPHPAPALVCVSSAHSRYSVNLAPAFKSHTDSNGLDFEAIFDVGIASIIGVLVLQDALAAKGVDKGCTA